MWTRLDFKDLGADYCMHTSCWSYGMPNYYATLLFSYSSMTVQDSINEQLRYEDGLYTVPGKHFSFHKIIGCTSRK